MADRLILLGTKGGPAIRQGGAMPTSSYLELGGRRAVIDCGLGVTKALVEAGIDLRRLDMVFITHLHSDHVLELGPLIHTAWTTGLARNITLYGPKGLRAYWQGFLAAMQFDNGIRVADEGRVPLEDLVTLVEFAEGRVIDDGAVQVHALRVDHPPVTDCFALRFQAQDRVVTFSADTCYFPPLADFARGSDILVHEAMLQDGVDLIVQKTGLGEKLRQHLMNSHTLARDSARIAQEAGVKHLVLHHLIPVDDPRFTDADWQAATRDAFDGPVTVGRDGMVLPLDG